MFQALMQPAARLMSRLRFRNKFVVLVVFALMPLLVTGAMLWHATQQRIDFSLREQLGLEVMKPLPALLAFIVEYRSATLAAAQGDTNSKARADALGQSIAEQLRAHGTRVADIEGTLQLSAAWRALSEALASAQRERREGSLDSIQRSADRLVTVAIATLSHLAEASNLTLDPELSSYKVMDLMFMRLPAVMDGIGALSAQVSALLASNGMSRRERGMLVARMALARDGLERARSEATRLAELVPAEARAFKQVLEYITTVESVIETLRTRVLEVDLQEMTASDICDLQAKADAVLVAAFEVSAPVLRRLLDARIENLRGQFQMMFGAIALSLLLAAYLFAGFYSSMLSTLSRVSAHLGRLAEGDLSNQRGAPGRDELARISEDVARTAQGLRGIVVTMSDGAARVTETAQKIASGNDDLNQRTGAQSQRLSQVAATVDEFTRAIETSAEHASQANALARRASSVAGQGGAVIDEVVSTMEGIAASSLRIGEVNALIDGIAFQTNILALNAAVEAARAGEAGRGFAVVASEVRALALRSTEAAKQIKSLTRHAVEQAESGSELVRNAGGTMSEIVAAVNDLGTMIDQISHATREQSDGIRHINEVVGHLDQMTGDNADLVKDTAAAASHLREQAHSLGQAVGVFRFDEVAVIAPLR